MKILFADKFEDFGLEALTAAGHEITYSPNLTAELLPEQIKGYNLLIVRSTQVSKAAIEASDKLSLIVRAGAGTNTIAVDEAAAKGIFVCNCPGKNAIAVAELAFGLLITVDRNIADNVIELRKGNWDKKKFSQADGLWGQKIGILGLGQIGLALAERAAAFGMQVQVLKKPTPRSPETEDRLKRINPHYCESLEQLLNSSYAISLHIPVNEQTKGLVNQEFLSHMQPGAIVINTSRGQIIDDAALIMAMDEKNIKAGLDVFNDEPGSGQGSFSTPLSLHPNVYGTHHIGASTKQAQNAIAEEVIRIIDGFSQGSIFNCVNSVTNMQTEATLTIRHYDKVGVLASVFAELRSHEINVEEMQNLIFKGAKAACATIKTNRKISPALLKDLRQIESVISVET